LKKAGSEFFLFAHSAKSSNCHKIVQRSSMKVSEKGSNLGCCTLGLGERREEVLDLLRDLRKAGCDFLTIGQYLQPRPDRLPVIEYVPPEEFEEYKRIGEGMGFKSVASGPFVRSSFHASEMFEVQSS
jgi:lipoate synthase